MHVPILFLHRPVRRGLCGVLICTKAGSGRKGLSGFKCQGCNESNCSLTVHPGHCAGSWLLSLFSFGTKLHSRDKLSMVLKRPGVKELKDDGTGCVLLTGQL